MHVRPPFICIPRSTTSSCRPCSDLSCPRLPSASPLCRSVPATFDDCSCLKTCPRLECPGSQGDSCSSTLPCQPGLNCVGGKCACLPLDCRPLPGCSYQSPPDLQPCRRSCGLLVCDPAGVGQSCTAPYTCAESLRCDNAVCTSLSEPVTGTVWISSSLTLFGVPASAFNRTSFEQFVHSILSNRFGDAIRGVLVLSAQQQTRRSDDLRVVIRVVTEESQAFVVEAFLKSSEFLAALRARYQDTTMNSVETQRASPSSAKDSKSSSMAVIIACVCAAVILVALVIILVKRKAATNKQSHGRTADTETHAMFSNPVYQSHTNLQGDTPATYDVANKEYDGRYTDSDTPATYDVADNGRYTYAGTSPAMAEYDMPTSHNDELAEYAEPAHRMPQYESNFTEYEPFGRRASVSLYSTTGDDSYLEIDECTAQ